MSDSRSILSPLGNALLERAIFWNTGIPWAWAGLRRDLRPGAQVMVLSELDEETGSECQPQGGSLEPA